MKTAATTLIIALFGLSIVGCTNNNRNGGQRVNAGLEAYDPCEFTSECRYQADSCQTLSVDWEVDTGVITSEGKICSQDCNVDADCPIWVETDSQGVCLALHEGDPNLCFQPCVGDLDCSRDYVCDRQDGVGICLPFLAE